MIKFGTTEICVFLITVQKELTVRYNSSHVPGGKIFVNIIDSNRDCHFIVEV
jgi:hypothetical protein